MIVMKFGGTSMEDAFAIRNAASIILREKRSRLVVVSACAGVTDALVSTAESAADGAEQTAQRMIDALEILHSTIAGELLHPDFSDRFTNQLWKNTATLRKLVQSVSLLRELTSRTLDQFMCFGERWSSLLIYLFLLQRDIPVELIDATSVMITDHEFNRAAPLWNDIEITTQEILVPLLMQNKIVITQGFVGATREEVVTTLGRGGSDYTASILGAALDCEEIQIWTDVNGILTADPSILPEARPISQLTFDEASELAYFGARVLHPSTILPAVRKNIPVRILNSKSLEQEGTLIQQNSQNDLHIAKSIAYKEGITVITIKSTEMLMSYTFLARLFEIFSRYEKRIDVVSTAKTSVSITLDDPSKIDEIVRDLEQFAEVQVEHGKAVFCIVGENLKAFRGIASKVFGALDDARVYIDMISNGASHLNLTFVIDEAQIVTAVRALHDELFSASPVRN